MPNAIDVTLVVLVLAWGAWDHFFAWPRFARAMASSAPGARPRFYREVAAGEWALTVAILLAWFRAHRPLADLGLSLPAGARLAVGAGLCVVLAVVMWLQARNILALTPERRARARARLPGPAAAVLPHTRGEWAGFFGLSLTAGTCEELIARGFLIWFVGAWTGPWIALVVSSVLFGLGHAYQGRKGIVQTGVVGLAMGLVYLGTHSLLPGMVLHALIDAGSGTAVYLMFREDAAAA